MKKWGNWIMLYIILAIIILSIWGIFEIIHQRKKSKKRSLINKAKALTIIEQTQSIDISNNNNSGNPSYIPEAGQIIGEYTIVEKIGFGGMGIIMKAIDSHESLVALKIIRSEHLKNQSLQDRFQQEMDIVSRLEHENIASILGWGVDNIGCQYFAMEFVDGDNVRELLENNAINLNLALNIFTQLCKGLQYAHSKNIIHRDIKPENIIFSKDKILKIVDFGIARVDDEKSLSLTMTNISMGSPIYMSPEQKNDFSNADARTDIYAAGALFYEMLSGDMPGGLLRLDLIPRNLRFIIEKSIAYRAKDRYQSMDELIADIELYDNKKEIINDQIAMKQIAEHVKLREASINSFYRKTPNKQSGLDIESCYIPAEGIGGNYYDYIEIDETHTGILVGNLFDHIDIESLLFLSMLRAAFRIYAVESKHPKETFQKLNDFMSKDRFNNFAVLSYLIFDSTTKELSVSTAGYRPVKILKKDENQFTDIQLDGLAIAIIEDYIYEERLVTLNSGDLILLSSAGAGKSVNREGQIFGDDKILNLVIQNRNEDCKVLVDGIKNTILRYGAGTAQQDDITLVVAKVI